MYELTVTASFSSAHNLRGYEGACENLHGHNWRVEATVTSKTTDRVGMALDFKVLKTALSGILDSLDHKYLNDLAPFRRQNATAENLARFVFTELKKALKGKKVTVASVKIWESETAAAAYRE